MALKSALINVMTNAATKTARRLVRDFGEVEQLQVSKKGPAGFVSTADQRAERDLRTELTRARPTYGLAMNGKDPVAGTDKTWRWIVASLDGTTNFLHGIPHFAISIAAEHHGEIVAGVIHDPVRDETFWAEKGNGAYLNDRRLRVSAREKLLDSVIATSVPSLGSKGRASFLSALEAVINQVAGVRQFGSAALDLSYVAAGRYDGFWKNGHTYWDIAAGIVVAREAGGFVTDLKGNVEGLAGGQIVAANDRLQGPLRKLVGGAVDIAITASSGAGN